MPQAPSTPEALLDAAERLFADRGFRGSSLRAITAEADANLAAVHYHFGSKEDLLRAVLSRRIVPVNQERLRRLDACREAGEGVAGILRAFIGPVLEMRWGPTADPGHRDFARIMSRALLDPKENLQDLFAAQFAEVFERFSDALAECLPTLSRVALEERFHFAAGAMAHTVLGARLQEALSGPEISRGDGCDRTERLVAFLAPGFHAPPSEEAP